MRSNPKFTRAIESVRLDLIRRDPRQPRELFDEEDIKELALSIKKKGLIQLTVIKPDPEREGRFLIIAGERRYRALVAGGFLEYEFVVYRGDLGANSRPALRTL